MKTTTRILIMFMAAACAWAQAAPKAELWAKWEARDDASTQTVSHDAWDEFLGRYLSESGGVALLDYAGVTDADKALLDGYVQALENTQVSSLNMREQMAYWINLYNALTAKVILDNYPVESIKDIGSWFSGPWDEKYIMVEGEEISLNDIEHRILRPIWKDARVHYAVNCASIGCPNLATKAYTAENTEAMLEQSAADYVNHPRGTRVEDGMVHASSIYEWFAEDFGGTDASVIAHLKKYAGPELGSALEGTSEIAGYGYDWSLNEAQ